MFHVILHECPDPVDQKACTLASLSPPNCGCSQALCTQGYKATWILTTRKIWMLSFQCLVENTTPGTFVPRQSTFWAVQIFSRDLPLRSDWSSHAAMSVVCLSMDIPLKWFLGRSGFLKQRSFLEFFSSLLPFVAFLEESAIFSAQKIFTPKLFFTELSVKQGATQCYQAIQFCLVNIQVLWFLSAWAVLSKPPTSYCFRERTTQLECSLENFSLHKYNKRSFSFSLSNVVSYFLLFLEIFCTCHWNNIQQSKATEKETYKYHKELEPKTITKVPPIPIHQRKEEKPQNSHQNKKKRKQLQQSCDRISNEYKTFRQEGNKWQNLVLVNKHTSSA